MSLSYHTIGKKGHNCTDCTASMFSIQPHNRLPRHTVSLNHHLLLNHIRQNLCWILDGYQARLLGAVPYYVEPVALSVAVRLQPLVGRQLDEFSRASTRLDFDATYLTRL